MPFDIRLYKDLWAATNLMHQWSTVLIQSTEVRFVLTDGHQLFPECFTVSDINKLCGLPQPLGSCRFSPWSLRPDAELLLLLCAWENRRKPVRCGNNKGKLCNFSTTLIFNIFLSSWHANMEIFAHLPVITGVLHWWSELISDNWIITVYYFYFCSMQLGRKMFIHLILHGWWIIKISIPAAL